MSGEKTEKPTPKRLREAREKGEVCKSQDIAAALTVLALAVYLIAMGPSVFKTLVAMTQAPFDMMTLPFEEAAPKAASIMTDAAFDIVFPAVALVMLVALASNLAQVGFLFALKGAMPKLENLDPQKWFKKTFAMKNLVELLKNFIKVGVLGFAVYYALSDRMRYLFNVRAGKVWDLWTLIGDTATALILTAAAMFCVVAGLDYLYQRWQYTKQHMMAKDEVKREYKEMEGDPQIKGKRKQLHRELLAQGAMDNVRKSTVLVTNPTHYAVALYYEKDKTPLPLIMAKGEGFLAERMIAVAKQEGIPIMRNVPLARGLFEEGTENSYIPKEFIVPIAEVLRWINSLKR